MRTPILLAASVAIACSTPSRAPEPGDPRIATVEELRAARARGDLDAARALLGDDPRIWYGAKEGEGAQWSLEGGRWHDWDEHFLGTAERSTPWHSESDRVWADMLETNDYYRLTGRSPRPWRGTYYFDAGGRIAGFMISQVEGAQPDPGRREEFEAWARANRPEEAEYLMPAGSIDPTGDRPARMRALLCEWRAAVGLPAIE